MTIADLANGSTMSGLIWLLVALIVGGLFAGFMSGLLGVGGGGVLVPVLYEAFGAAGVDESVRMHMAVGTSLAIVASTSLRVLKSHRARGAVDMLLLRRLGPWIVCGVSLGVLTAGASGGPVLKWTWVVFGTVMASKLAFAPAHWRLGEEIPRSRLVEAYAVAVGFVSVLLSIAGAAFTVMLMTLYNRPILQAVGTSSGFGPMIAIPGLVGFMWAGWHAVGTPPFSLGYVNLLAAGVLIPAGLIAAPFGVRLAHRISRRHLELAFAAFLYLVALRFFVSLMG